MNNFRIENDRFGEKQIPENALYGIHTQRALDNFPDRTPFSLDWYKAMGFVKWACYQTYRNFKNAVFSKYPNKFFTFKLFENSIIDVLELIAIDISQGRYFEHFLVPAIQGGAGTSINMNVNEIITNAALIKLGKKAGNYTTIDPIEHANVYQSTNDVVPTALKVATMQLLNVLESEINVLRTQIENIEKKTRNNLRIGYTQMQEAVPSSFGKLFSTYSDALSRDWWRVSKCFERIKVVNIGGSAIGTGIAVPRFFIMQVADNLQKITHLQVTRSENMLDTTANLDSFVEVHAILKSHAVNLEKMVNDIRLLSSDLSHQLIKIPQVQVGSSIMPGKVNPVIPEFVISASHKIYSNDMLISSLAAQGCLELNAYLPMIGHALLESINLLIQSNQTLKTNLFDGLEIDSDKAEKQLFLSPAVTTVLNPMIGYNKAAELSKYMKTNHVNIFEANKKLQIISEEQLAKIMDTQYLTKIGFTIEDTEFLT